MLAVFYWLQKYMRHAVRFVVPHIGRVVGAVHTRALPEVGVLLEAKDTP